MVQIKIPTKLVDCKNFIAGSWVKGEGDRLKVESPYSATDIGEVSFATEAQVNLCMDKAQEAFLAWSKTPIKERTQYLFRFRQILTDRMDEVAHMAALESGKTFGEAKAEVAKGLEVAEFALSQQNFDLGGSLEVSRGVTCRYKREPLGVCVGITPFNFPCMVPMWMIPIAMAAGNSFVLKPSEKVPLTSQLLGEIINEAGFPAGVFSVVHGGKDVVEALTNHELTKAVGFVGSTAIAEKVYQMATHKLKRASTLGGAKNLLLVTPDASEDVTIKGVVDSFTGCAGQRCMAASLMVAVGDVDHIITKVVDKASKVELAKDMGAIIDKASYDRIIGILDRAEKSGVKFLLDGRNVKAPAGFDNGYWIGPTVLEASTTNECAQVEIFGPVVTIVRVKSLAEAMELENAQPYGNATSVFTTSGDVADYVSTRASNGMIGINIGVPVPREPFSFGGTKASRFGANDITGHDGVDFWTYKKKITSKWAVQADQNWMS